MRKPIGFRSKKDRQTGKRWVYPIMPKSSTPSSWVIPKNMEEARRLHESRSERAQIIDEALEARITTDYAKWAKAPNKWDIRGIDLFPAPTLPNDFVNNVKVLAYASEQYYNKDLSDIKIFAHTEDSFDKAYGLKGASHTVYAFAVPDKKEVHFSPEAVKTVTKGKIENEEDFWSFHAVAHEIGHVVGTMPGRGVTAFDEGSNELLAVRFAINNIQMPRELRAKLLSSPSYTYAREVHLAADTAILVNDGDKEKAVDWLVQLKKADPEKRNKMINEAGAKLERTYGIKEMYWSPFFQNMRFSDTDKQRREEMERMFKVLRPEWYEKTHGSNFTWWAKV